MSKNSWPFPALFDSLFSEFSLVPCLPGTNAPRQRALWSGTIESVYRAKLPYRCKVTIKQAECNATALVAASGVTSTQSALCAELLLMSRVNHNLLQLLGFCDKRILVFEFILSTARSATPYMAAAATARRRAPLQRALHGHVDVTTCDVIMTSQ